MISLSVDDDDEVGRYNKLSRLAFTFTSSEYFRGEHVGGADGRNDR